MAARLDVAALAYQFYVVRLALMHGKRRSARRWIPTLRRRIEARVRDIVGRCPARDEFGRWVALEAISVGAELWMPAVRDAAEASFACVCPVTRRLTAQDEDVFWASVWEVAAMITLLAVAVTPEPHGWPAPVGPSGLDEVRVSPCGSTRPRGRARRRS